MRDFLRLRQRHGEIERSEEELVGLACIVCRGFLLLKYISLLKIVYVIEKIAIIIILHKPGKTRHHNL